MSAPAPDPVRIGIVSISDRASSGVYEDKGLPALRDCSAASAAWSSPPWADSCWRTIWKISR